MNQFESVLRGFRLVETIYGDTLQRIAARELGDAERWPELAQLNDLHSPYFIEPSEAAQDGLLRYGDMLLVPSAGTATASAQTNPDLVFEIDCKLSGGLLEAENGDFIVAAGRENLRQALNHRIRTDQGELVFHADYRCLVHRIIGRVNGPTAGLLAGEYVKAALLRDPRVQSVTSVDVTISGDQIQVAAEVIPIAGRPITVEV